jgi:putative tryptophan/tyrosine transport system substrate-binding protein
LNLNSTVVAQLALKVDRCAFLAGSLGLLATPPVAEAQPPAKVYRIGLLGGSPPTSPEATHLWEGFFQVLRDLGYVEGQNVVIEGRWYGDRSERLPALGAGILLYRAQRGHTNGHIG